MNVRVDDHCIAGRSISLQPPYRYRDIVDRAEALSVARKCVVEPPA